MTCFFTGSLNHMCFLKFYCMFVEDVQTHSTVPLYCTEALSETDLPFKGQMAQFSCSTDDPICSSLSTFFSLL